MRRLLCISIIVIISLLFTVSCEDSSTSPDPDNEEAITYDFSLDINPDDAGEVTPSFDDTTYEEGDEIELEAGPGKEYVFTEWTGDVESTENPLSLTIDQDYELTANFEKKEYELTIDTEGGGDVNEEVLEDKSKDYEHGTVVELTAEPDEGYVFVEWKGDIEGSENPEEITVDDPKEVTAVFEKKEYELSVDTEGEGNVKEVLEQKSKEYDYGSVVELTAEPAEGYTFVEWKGDVEGSENPEEITVDEPQEVTAVFEKKEFELTLNTEGEGFVSEEVVQQKTTDYEYGTVVELTANPDEGWKFDSWKGVDKASENPVKVTVDTAREVTAKFERQTFELTVDAENGGSVSVSPDQNEFEYNSTVELEAQSEDGYNFAGWKGDISSDDNPVEITMDEKKELTAEFKSMFYRHDNGVTVLCPDAEPGDKGKLDGEESSKEYEAVNREMLKEKISLDKDLTVVCTTHITLMANLFSGEDSFNQDISSWDVSNVTHMNDMFETAADFNKDISEWDVSNVEDMSRMFAGAKSFNQDLNSWNVSSVTNMLSMFVNADKFNYDLDDWDVSNVKNMDSMFSYTENFNADITTWDVSNVTDMGGMFHEASRFNQYIGSWDVSNVTDMSGIFRDAPEFDRDISDWDVSSVDGMVYMFWGAESFNQDLSGWCVSNIDSEPTNFDANSAFEDDDALQPDWGNCPE